MTTLQQLADGQTRPDVPINENFETLSAAGIYGKRHPATTGLTWAYYGGLYGGHTVADGTVSLTNTADNYVVVQRATGAVSVSTGTTNWASSSYARLYKVTTAGGVVTAVVDHRWDTNGLIFTAGATVGTAGTLDYDTDGTLAADSDAKIATQKATKTYVDAKLAGLSWKQAVRAATTANGTLASAFANGQTIDGVTLATGDRILLKNQSTASENGIYTVNASGAPARSTDADSGAELVNATVYVSEGATLADTQWTCTTNAPITVGSTSLAFAQITTGTFTGGTLSAALNEAPAATIASASTVNIGAAAANTVNISGTTTITAFDSIADGAKRRVTFAGALTLTHNGTSLILPTGANINTAAGDSAEFVSLGSGNWRCVQYQRASGKPLTPPLTCIAIACSDEFTALTTGTAKAKFVNPFSTAFNVVAVLASLSTAQASGSLLTVNIKEAGTTILSTKITINNTATNSSGATTPPVISDASIAAYAEISVDVDQVGDGTAKGLKVYVVGYPS